MIESLGSFEGKYEIIERIGEGGMGAVYKVKHTLLNEIRVIKTMRSHVMHQEENRERFFREARLAAKARHENIAQVFDFSVEGDVALIVMEFIDGVTLQDVLARHGTPSLSLTLEIAQQSLRALAYVHKMNVIHRDISPDNLMLTADSDGDPKIKLIDLGLAKPTEADGGLTREGFFLGKLRYASPEQFDVHRGAKVGTYSDVYSFGLVFYQLLTGRYPISGRDLPELMAGHMTQPPMPFSESDPDGNVPERLREIVFKALEKKSENRFPDGEAFRVSVRAVQANYPCGQKERKESIQLCERPPSPEPTEKPGSSQSRLGRAFPVDQSSAGLTDSAEVASSIAGTAALAGFGKDGMTTPLPMKPDIHPADDRDPSGAGTQVRDGSEAGTQVGASSKAGTMVGAGSRAGTQMRDHPQPAMAGRRSAQQDVEDLSEHVEPDRFAISSPRPVALPSKPAGTKMKWLLGAAAAVIVLGLAVTLLLTGVIDLPGRGEGPDRAAVDAPIGRLEINAIPWAKIIEITSDNGQRVDLGEARYTPLGLPLAPGSYRIVLRNDEFGEKTVDVEVKADTTTSEVVPFAEIGEEQLLRSLRLIE
jgi:serine/threonine protein kinase